MQRNTTAPVNVAWISVATSGTDFTAPKTDFAALIRAAGLLLGDHICHVELQELGRRLVRSWHLADVEPAICDVCFVG